MDEKIFNRVEKKYLIDKEQQRRLIEIIETHLKKSKYFELILKVDENKMQTPLNAQW